MYWDIVSVQGSRTTNIFLYIGVDYNFETKTLVSFRLYTITAGSYLDIEMTEDNKNKIYFLTMLKSGT